MFGDLMQMVGDHESKSMANRLQERRAALLELIAKEYPDKSGLVLFLAPVEGEHQAFIQDSSFYYFSGILEPATALIFGLSKPTVYFTPDFGDLREKWVHSVNVINAETKKLYAIDEICLSGKRVAGYQIDPYFSATDYQFLIDHCLDLISKKQMIFTLYPQHSLMYARVKMVLDRLAIFIPGLMQHVVDISALVAKLRRKKDMSEIESMYQAIGITQAAFQAASHIIKPGVSEAEVQAAIEYIFTENGAQKAYSSIVAGAVRATILHYHTNNMILREGELVLIDAGAMFNHYCADITRVFPVSGKFNKQQKKLYEIVLDAQELVADAVRPGMWINDAQHPEMSLQHIAINFLKQHKVDQYFIHGIGHYLGLDVHDVGSRATSLEVGDVITIEPGIYMPQESTGIRIEDNYWVIADAPPVCLSEEIPKSIVDVEAMVRQNF
jgi:Xaa-Pro aminopeptidase